MRVVLDMLARRCAKDKIQVALNSQISLRQYIDDNWNPSDFKLRASKPECEFLDEGLTLYKGGNGNLGSWREFTRRLNETHIDRMTPTDEHFIEVSRLAIAASNKNFGSAGTASPSSFPIDGCASSALYAGELMETQPTSTVAAGSFRIKALNYAQCRARYVRTSNDTDCKRGTLKLSHIPPPSASG